MCSGKFWLDCGIIECLGNLRVSYLKKMIGILFGHLFVSDMLDDS